MSITRPVLKRNTLAPKTKNDSRVLAGRAENTNQLKLHYLGRFRVTSPEPEVITIEGESLVASTRTELSPIFVASHLLAPRVADHVGAFGKLYVDKGLTYEIHIAPEIALACEAQDLDELLGNLLDNASKWARQRVLVAADRVGTMVEMTIEDDGPGLSDQQTTDVMKPGHRIDESAPGYGFRLPITRRAG